MLIRTVQSKQLLTFLNWSKKTPSVRLKHNKKIELYGDCYRVLGVRNYADQETVRNAYIEWVKKVHPDSGSTEACSERFKEIDHAFKVLQRKFAKERRGIEDTEGRKLVSPEIRHTPPQHRSFLSYDGVGVGTPSQRQRLYERARIINANEQVLNYRFERADSKADKSVLPDRNYFKKHHETKKKGVDGIVEDLIQKAMAKGDFDNLPGAGKPLKKTQPNPHLDSTTEKINQILKESGFVPEWILLQRDIAQAITDLKNSIRKERAFFGEFPLNETESKEWKRVLTVFAPDVQRINRMIETYNLSAPSMRNHMFRICLGKISTEILKDPKLVKNLKRSSDANQFSNTMCSIM